MTKKIKILIIAVFGIIATVCVCIVAGCKVNFTIDELREKYGLTAQVTYFLNNGNGGTFNDESYVKNIYYPAGTYAYDIGTDALISGSADLKPQAGYNFTGWYLAAEEDGVPLYRNGEKYNENEDYDVSNGIQSSGNKFDFKNTVLKSGDHYYVCADWYEDMRLRLILDSKDGDIDEITYTVNDKTHTVKKGEELVGLEYKIDKVSGLGNVTSSIKIDGYTVYGMYDGDELFDSWPIKYPDQPNEEGVYEDIKLNVKLLKGEWNIVRTATDAAMIFNSSSGSYYIDSDIDLGGRAFSNINNYTGKIKGNGYTISNFIIRRSQAISNASAAMFGTIRSSAEIKDVTFKDFEASFTIGQNASGNIRFISNTIEEGAVIENFNIDGGALKINLNRGSIHETYENDWLFGNKDDASYTDIMVRNSSCTITYLDGSNPPVIFNKI